MTQHRRRPPAFRAPRLAVDLREALGLTGMLVKYLSVSAVVPAVVALLYSEPPWPFLAAGAIAFAAGFGLERLGSRSRGIGFREGYLVVALTWLIAAIFGAIPYLLSGEPQLDSPVDAFFESMSGFSTTGASILTNVDSVDHSLLLWRQFTQWLGGMGIIVLALAVLPRLRVGGRQLLDSELAGPETEALSDRIRTTARRLWLLYIALTAVLATVLVLFGVVGIDHGWGCSRASRSRSRRSRPVASRRPGIAHRVGCRHAVGRDRVHGHRRDQLRARLPRARPASLAAVRPRIRSFASISASSPSPRSRSIAELWTDGLAKGEEAVRHGVFQVVSITTTTGFASADFSTWATFGLMLLLALMFVGGSAGSTGSSVKVVRHLLVARSLRRELRQTLHPEEVLPVRLNGRVVQEKMLRSVVAFVLLYIGLFVIGAAVVAIDTAIEGPSISAIDAIAAAATTLGNVGPGLGVAGPLGSFASYPDVSKLTLSGLMWLGRLEIIPVVVVLTRHYWRVR